MHGTVKHIYVLFVILEKGIHTLCEGMFVLFMSTLCFIEYVS